MNDFEDFRASIARTFASVVANGEATTRFAEETEREFARVWADNAELRDELHALANRVETLTRARLTEPAEVAERMIFTCRLNPGCNVSSPHIHDDDGAVIYVRDEATADDQLRQRALVQSVKDGFKS